MQSVGSSLSKSKLNPNRINVHRLDASAASFPKFPTRFNLSSFEWRFSSSPKYSIWIRDFHLRDVRTKGTLRNERTRSEVSFRAERQQRETIASDRLRRTLRLISRPSLTLPLTFAKAFRTVGSLRRCVANFTNSDTPRLLYRRVLVRSC